MGVHKKRTFDAKEQTFSGHYPPKNVNSTYFKTLTVCAPYVNSCQQKT